MCHRFQKSLVLRESSGWLKFSATGIPISPAPPDRHVAETGEVDVKVESIEDRCDRKIDPVMIVVVQQQAGVAELVEDIAKKQILHGTDHDAQRGLDQRNRGTVGREAAPMVAVGIDGPHRHRGHKKAEAQILPESRFFHHAVANLENQMAATKSQVRDAQKKRREGERGILNQLKVQVGIEGGPEPGGHIANDDQEKDRRGEGDPRLPVVSLRKDVHRQKEKHDHREVNPQERLVQGVLSPHKKEIVTRQVEQRERGLPPCAAEPGHDQARDREVNHELQAEDQQGHALKSAVDDAGIEIERRRGRHQRQHNQAQDERDQEDNRFKAWLGSHKAGSGSA
jgi:hypothetical protein